MTRRFKLKISSILSFKSCRLKDPSDLPFNPVPSFPRRPPPAANPSSTIVPTVPQRRRSSFRQHVFTTFGCGSTRPRTSTPLDVSQRNSPSLSPPQTPTFQWESEGKWHVIAQVDEGEYETPRRKIYDGDDRRRSVKKERYARRRGSTSSAEEYEEETERESLLSSSTNLSPESSSSGLPRVTRRRRNPPKRKSTSSVVGEKSESSSPPPSPVRLLSFVQRLIPCTAATAAVVVEGVAVVKRSEDPYEDFKGSMMEMIVEKNMFEVPELEQLLRCFLTLNEKRHHRAIVKAFSEVWVALFSGGNSRRSSVRLSDYDEC